ncbi:succinate dehydrogenase cytochrome b subunit [Flavihumibacter cheonanensis]|uniref:succinate dehydrogenase cytochrome b subunit n=1 Tax=Flavihumibacter cheonanensis TaxID=1442385 RepID=UPI001EF98E26|nr:succinate dehydrogenase cytochrome b subunit [Flavihumibacter cheonanensis]MCG7751282.1 succinate dehydrogenase cytochrome b subunit [Flavihumibacter cheonanensis]
MQWSEFFTSSVGKKFVMGLTGLFLISFLVIHVGINATIFADLVDPDENGAMFNKAAHFMGSTVLIRILEIGLFAGIILHIVQGYMLEAKNRSARSVGYAVNLGNRGSKWYSRAMGLLGTIILLFLIIHMAHFWVKARITHTLAPVTYNGVEMHDMFSEMKAVFSEGWVIAVYLLGCISLGYHLAHGFQSAFRTVGVHNNKYNSLLVNLGYGFSILVSLLFALMPVAMYFGWVG